MKQIMSLLIVCYYTAQGFFNTVLAENKRSTEGLLKIENLELIARPSMILGFLSHTSFQSPDRDFRSAEIK